MNIALNLMHAGLPLLQAQEISNQDGAPVAIGASVTIDAQNAKTYDGKTLVWSGAFTVTLAAGIPAAFGFTGVPPASGNASIASDGTVTLMDTVTTSTTTRTRARADNTFFAVLNIASNSYGVSGL